MTPTDETIAKFESLADEQKNIIIGKALGPYDVIWANICTVYNLPLEHRMELRNYIRKNYKQKGA